MAMAFPMLLVKVLLTAGVLAAVTGMFVAWSWALRRLASGQPLLTHDSRPIVTWSVWHVAVTIAVYLGLPLLLMETYQGFTGKPWPKQNQAQELILLAVNSLAAIVLIPLVVRGRLSLWLELLGTDRATWRRAAIVGAVAFLLLTPLVHLVNLLAVLIWKPHKHPLQDMIQQSFTAKTALLTWISACILAPAIEELMFRGILLGWLTRLRLADDRFAEPPELEAGEPIPGPDSPPDFDLEEPRSDSPHRTWDSQPSDMPSAPVVWTAAVFAIVHVQQWPAPLALFVLALGLGTVYQRTGSLVAPIVLHALFNALSTSLLFLQVLSGQPAPPVPEPPLPASLRRAPELRNDSSREPLRQWHSNSACEERSSPAIHRC
jgi:membrane protease YdiL (CAAX protease family)